MSEIQENSLLLSSQNEHTHDKRKLTKETGCGLESGDVRNYDLLDSSSAARSRNSSKSDTRL